jgi:hypothetical protein
MTRILAIADEVDRSLYGDTLTRLRPDLVVSCGDLPFDYLEYIVTVLSVPLLYVPGNHDPDVRARRTRALSPAIGAATGESGRLGSSLRLRGMDELPGARGCINVDGRIERAAGLRVAGLGGSHRYTDGPNQYTQKEMRRRARRLTLRAMLGGRRGGRRLDVLTTHAPPLGRGDEDDLAHRGFAALHDIVRRLSPRILVHGHLHPFGEPRPDRQMGNTLVVTGGSGASFAAGHPSHSSHWTRSAGAWVSSSSLTSASGPSRSTGSWAR